MRPPRVLIAVAALALPLTVVGPQLANAAATVYFPITCLIHGNVSYSPPLTQAGTDSTNKLANETTTITGANLTGCISSNSVDQGTTSGSIGDLTISTPPVKGLKIAKVQHYETGQCIGFASAATLKALKGLTLTTTWSGQGIGGSGQTVVTSKGGSVAANGSTGEAGFNITGLWTSGDYEVKKIQATVYLNNTGDIAQCAAGTPGFDNIASSTIDAAVSSVTM